MTLLETLSNLTHRRLTLALAVMAVGCQLSGLVRSRDSLAAEDAAVEYDVVVYGGTSAGVAAAVQVRRMGKTVIIVGPDKHLGGLTAGGLGWTDSGNKNAVGGLSREFYQRIWAHYQTDDAWTWQPKSEFGTRNQSRPGKDGDSSTMWVFEPKVAEAIYESWTDEHDIPVVRGEYLQRPLGAIMDGKRIKSIRMLSGNVYTAKMFIDATYEGDLMAEAGVSYHVGREANSVYGEDWNGVQVGVLHHSHFFAKPISPYVVPGDESSGLLANISNEPPGNKGEADKRIQAYCFRMCLTNNSENQIPFRKPAKYDPEQYALLLRVFDSGWREMFRKFDMMPNYKTDTNNHGPFSTDFIGMNYEYPEGTYEQRASITQLHRDYQEGLMYFMANDSRVPEGVRRAMSKWGLAADEFTDNAGWPHQLYVREARRMIGDYVMTEHDCLDKVVTPDSIGMGSYTLDSHNVQRYVTPQGYVQNEGDIGIKTPRPYKIAYGSIVPKREECENLFVPICASASHIAFGSIRMEPVFMILGQSAATAASQSIDRDIAVQDLDYAELRERLLADGQILELETKYSFDSSLLPGIVLDESKAEHNGTWQSSTANGPYVNHGYIHNGNRASSASVVFSTKVKAAKFQVGITWPANDNRASSVPVKISHLGGETIVKIDQRKRPGAGTSLKFYSLGEYEFGGPARIEVLTSDTDGYVVVDAIQLLPVK